jgi:outer membrane biosynthesis protein TonB
MRRALVTCGGSIAFHAAFVALAVLVAASKHEPRSVAVAAPANPIDVWSGVTAAIGGERLVDVNVDALGGQPGPAGQAAPPSPPAAPAPPPPPPAPPIAAAPAPIPAVEKPAPAVEKPALADDPAGLEPRPKPRTRKPKPVAVAVDPAASSSAVDPALADENPARPAPPASPRPAKRRAGGGASGDGGDGAKTGPFGAEGPSAVRSLGRAFTRAIPAACQADPGWGALPAGDAGAIEIAVTIDETGHIAGYRPLGKDPPKQLLALVKRTIALLDAGTFELKGNVGAGVEVLRIQAGVSDLEAAEVGGTAALSFGEGKAAFTQESGRHVEVTLRVVKVDVPTTAEP